MCVEDEKVNGGVNASFEKSVNEIQMDIKTVHKQYMYNMYMYMYIHVYQMREDVHGIRSHSSSLLLN